MPIVMVIGASLTAGAYLSFPPQGLSLRWWEAMSRDPDMVNGFVVTTRIAVCAVLISVPAGALAAIYLGRLPSAQRNLLAAIFTSPLSVPLVLTGFSFLVFFTQVGLLNEIGLIIGHSVIAVPYILRSSGALSALLIGLMAIFAVLTTYRLKCPAKRILRLVSRLRVVITSPSRDQIAPAVTVASLPTRSGEARGGSAVSALVIASSLLGSAWVRRRISLQSA